MSDSVVRLDRPRLWPHPTNSWRSTVFGIQRRTCPSAASHPPARSSSARVITLSESSSISDCACLSVIPLRWFSGVSSSATGQS